MPTAIRLGQLSDDIIACHRCPRLVEHIRSVAELKVRRYRAVEYWGRPLPGFGDPNAKVLIVGLAPAAHGGNRTGRMFTGDSSGEWLIGGLHQIGCANRDTSMGKDDGLELQSVYVTAAVRCAPPGNKPTAEEIDNCSEYLEEELRLLEEVKIVLTLGKIAFEAYLRHVPPDKLVVKPQFRHGAIYRMSEDLPILAVSYHPSRQNTQTGRLKWGEWLKVLEEVKRLADLP